MNNIRRAYEDIGTGQIHYRFCGDNENPALVFLHQVPSHSEMYETLMLKLSDNFYCLAPDFPGFGGSDSLHEKITIPGVAAAFNQWLSAIGIDQCLMFGHHTGASVAVQWAYDFSGVCKAMALSGPTLLTPHQKANLPSMVPAIPVEPDGSHLVKMWQRMRAKDEHADLELIQREFIQAIKIGEDYPTAYQSVTEQPFAEQIAELDFPILVFAGTNDVLYGTLDETYALLKQGSKDEIQGSRTYVCERNSDEVALLLKDFYK